VPAQPVDATPSDVLIDTASPAKKKKKVVERKKKGFDRAGIVRDGRYGVNQELGGKPERRTPHSVASTKRLLDFDLHRNAIRGI
jgi:hypothetical protein